ncbi:MAG: gliding motility lipoprotein GldB [Chitinophagaceae bacterium]
MMQRYSIPRILLLIPICCFFMSQGCHSSHDFIPDVSKIHVNLNIQRFDEDLFMLDTNHLEKGLRQLHQKYPVFLSTFLVNIMNYGSYSDTSAVQQLELKSLLSSPDMQGLEDTVKAHFPHIRQLKSQLQSGFQFLQYYYPQYQIPTCVTFISGLNNFGAVTVDTLLGIGLDMFLGKDYPNYTQVADPYPQYMIRQFSREYIPADCFKVIEQQIYPFRDSGKPLLDQMINRGKQMYFLDKVMPFAPDSVKIGYSEQQLIWCASNEQFIWQYFIQNNLLYVHDMQQILHYIGDGPSTQGMPSQSPGNIGTWVGWQIVKQYMQKHPDIQLPQLMEEEDAQKILDQSGYRPR